MVGVDTRVQLAAGKMVVKNPCDFCQQSRKTLETFSVFRDYQAH